MRWVDNIKLEIGLDWSGPGKVQVESTCECGSEPLCSMKCWETISLLHNWLLLE
jgi:hypothetical protein